MDKHLRLFEMLPEGARDHLDLRYGERQRPEGYVQPMGHCWYDYDEITDEVAHAAIEHAARLHYEGEGYKFKRAGMDYYATDGQQWGTGYMPLIGALLAAAEHAREGGEGKK